MGMIDSQLLEGLLEKNFSHLNFAERVDIQLKWQYTKQKVLISHYFQHGITVRVNFLSER